MLHLPWREDALYTLKNVCIPSQVQPGATYKLGRVLGGGAMAVAFFSLRDAPDGQTPVVMKVLRPELVQQSGRNAELMVKKEAVALGRLNEHVPRTPFVVRLIDAGSVPAMFGDRALELPWLAIEYVHGGTEGTTLEERVDYSVEHTGHAFDQNRAARAIECLASGLTAIHQVGVVHRDMKPGNVLCCGFGQDEMFKIADFGIARPTGLRATFGSILVGTPGYASPEQLLSATMGPLSDVFAMASVIYFLLTGEEYFQAETPRESVDMIKSSNRRRLADARGLSPQLCDRPDACATIDAALARATAALAEHRPQSARELAGMILPALRFDSIRPFTADLRLQSVVAGASPRAGGWKWIQRHYPRGDDMVIRGAAWSGDGCCMAVTNQGLAFWDGMTWQPVPPRGLAHPERLHFIHAMATGVWLLGGDDSTIMVYTTEGVSKVLACPDLSVRFICAGGDVRDLAVFVGIRDEEPPLLYGVTAGRWLKPAALPKAAAVSSLSRIDGERWLVTGRTLAGDGFAVIYSPLMWEVERMKTPPTRAYLASTVQPNMGVGVIVGAEGQTIRIDKDTTHPTVVEGSPDLSAVALDIAGRAWAASIGRLWLQQPDMPLQWRCMWSDTQWQVPIVSVFADIGIVIGMTAHGGIIEGRLEFGQETSS